MPVFTRVDAWLRPTGGNADGIGHLCATFTLALADVALVAFVGYGKKPVEITFWQWALYVLLSFAVLGSQLGIVTAKTEGGDAMFDRGTRRYGWLTILATLIVLAAVACLAATAQMPGQITPSDVRKHEFEYLMDANGELALGLSAEFPIGESVLRGNQSATVIACFSAEAVERYHPTFVLKDKYGAKLLGNFKANYNLEDLRWRFDKATRMFQRVDFEPPRAIAIDLWGLDPNAEYVLMIGLLPRNSEQFPHHQDADLSKFKDGLFVDLVDTQVGLPK